jgi:hypothetical protein
MMPLNAGAPTMQGTIMNRILPVSTPGNAIMTYPAGMSIGNGSSSGALRMRINVANATIVPSPTPQPAPGPIQATPSPTLPSPAPSGAPVLAQTLYVNPVPGSLGSSLTGSTVSTPAGIVLPVVGSVSPLLLLAAGALIVVALLVR